MFKKLKGLFIIIFSGIIIASFFVYEYSRKIDTKYTYNEIIQLTSKANNLRNYKMTSVSESNGIKKQEPVVHYFKNGILKSTTNYKMNFQDEVLDETGVTWLDFNNDNTIIVSSTWHNDKYERTFQNLDHVNGNLYRGFNNYVLLNRAYDTIKYIDEEVYDGRDCIVVKAEKETVSYRGATVTEEGKIENKYEYVFYIDKEKGVILKDENTTYTKDAMNGEKIDSYNTYYKFEYDVVTDEDVSKPLPEDFPDYEVKNYYSY